MIPEQKAKRLNLIADEVDGARRLVTAARMGLDRAHADAQMGEGADAVCELLSEIGDRLKATAGKLREPTDVA